MTILIDSAKEQEVRWAKEQGWISGVTTNPSLLAQAELPPAESLRRLAALRIGPVWYQPVAASAEAMLAEVETARQILGDDFVVKLGPTPLGYRFAADQRGRYTTCITAVFHPAQALVAAEVGARYVAVYVNRATRALGSGLDLVEKTARALRGSGVGIIAASIKSADEASDSIAAGAELLTIGYETLSGLIRHPVTDETLARFANEGTGLG